jgi:hypothetical protein
MPAGPDEDSDCSLCSCTTPAVLRAAGTVTEGVKEHTKYRKQNNVLMRTGQAANLANRDRLQSLRRGPRSLHRSRHHRQSQQQNSRTNHIIL